MNNKNLDLTIVVPTLNAAKTIRTTLESLAVLREQGALVTIVDSYSEDGTMEAATGLFDHQISIPKGNMYAAINAGIAAANTRWVSYLNADDIVFPEILLAAMLKLDNATEMIYGDVDFIDFHGRFLHSYIFPGPDEIVPLATWHICGISPIGTIFKKSLWESLNGFDTSYRYSADFDFLLRAAMAGVTIKKIHGPTIGAFRLHGKQLSQNEGQPGLNENFQIVRRLNLKVSKFKRLSSLLKFKAANILEFFVRIIRHKRLTGSSFAECITPPSYQKE